MTRSPLALRCEVHAVKAPTTEDVTGGILVALSRLTRHPDIAGTQVDAIVIGTTHFINAVVQRRQLSKVTAVRIGVPASASLPPFCDLPADLAELVRAKVFMLDGGHDYDGRPIMPFDEAAMRAAARTSAPRASHRSASPRSSRRSTPRTNNAPAPSLPRNALMQSHLPKVLTVYK